jgi:hypothetical protein
MKKRTFIYVTVAALTATLFTNVAFPQNLVPDARKIAMGAVGNQGNLGTRLAEEQEAYRAIPIPLGLFQILKNLNVFNPGDPEFDPIRSIENLSNPMHITFDREPSVPASNIVRDLVNGRISRDLNAYRGFVPPSQIESQGLWAPSWGKTLNVRGDRDAGSSHGIYIGAGPYISLGTNMNIDQNLIDIFASSTNVYRPNTTFTIGDVTTGQGAIAITGGYRGRLAVFDSTLSNSGARDGVYIATNYHYLRGVHYDTVDLDVRFDTDSSGQVTLAPTTTPIAIDRTNAHKGNGFALDLGTAVVVRGWNFSVGANGIGNRINWDELRSEQLVLQSLFAGGNFVRRPMPAPAGTRKITLPVQYSGAGGYSSNRWSAQMEVSHGLQDLSVRNGVEYWVGPIALRGGTRYQLDRWHASTGVGLNLGSRFGIDLAAYQTTANVERKQKIALALSFRINRPADQ